MTERKNVTPSALSFPVCRPENLSHSVELAAGVSHFMGLSRAPSTLRAYRARWSFWCEWCAAHGAAPLPASPHVIAGYLSERALQGLSLSTVRGELATIATAHRLSFPNEEPPTSSAIVREVLRGIRRSAPEPKPARALLPEVADRMLAHLAEVEGLGARRDRAILLVGWALGARRSALVRLDWSDLEERPEGFAVRVRESKTDRDSGGRLVGLPEIGGRRCPVDALCSWRLGLEMAGAELGPLFVSVDRHGRPGARLSGRGLSESIRRLAAVCGLPDGYSGHSLRRGLATSAAAAGAGELAIMRQTGHRSVSTVRNYVEDGRIFRGNAARLALGEEDE